MKDERIPAMSDRTPLYDVAARAGAVLTEDVGWLVPAHYGDATAEYRQACERAALFDVSHRGKVEVAGKDAGTFLHNLCSNDTKNLAVGAGCEAFFLTVQARVVGHALIHRDGRDAFWLDLAPGLAEKVLKHLDRYLISEQVEFADRTRALAQFHLAGPEAKSILEQALPVKLPDLVASQQVQGILAGAPCPIRRHDPLGLPGYDILCPVSQAESVWQALTAAGARPAGLQAYEVLRIEAGTPVYGVDMDETNLAPEVGRTKQAISYAKGCYLGQEPVVRIRDLGHVNRTLLGLKITSSEPVPRGAKLFRDGKEAGQVTSSAVSPRLGTAIALAYVRRGCQQPGTPLDVEADGSRWTAEVVSLPFSSFFG
jgi:glycine cleavage system T protein